MQCLFTNLMENIILANTKSQKHTLWMLKLFIFYIVTFILYSINSTMKYFINLTNEHNFECYMQFKIADI